VRLRRETAKREREVAELTREVANLQRAQEELQRSEAPYRGVVASLPAALFAVDPDGVFTLMEGKDLEALGLEPDQVVGRSIFETYQHAPQIVENVRVALSGQLLSTVVEVDGKAFETRYSPWLENGEFSGVICVAIDITERRLAEEKLREAEARFRTLVEQIPAITYVEELRARSKVLTYMSPQYEAMLGYSPEEGISHPEHWLEIIHPEDRERVLAEDDRTDETLEPFEAEYRMIAKDGRVVWIRDQAVIVRDEHHRPLLWQGVMFDVTQRKEAEEALRQSEELYRTVMEQAAENIFLVDVETKRILEANAALHRSLGYALEELKDMTLYDIVAHDQQSVDRNIRHILAEGRHLIGERRYRRKDGSFVDVEVSASAISYGGGEAMCIVAHDITERKKAEEALRGSEASLAEAQRMAHLGSWEWDVRTGEVWWSDEVFRIHGFEPHAFVPTFEKLLDVVHPEDRKMLSQAVEAALHEDQPYDFEHRIVRPDGEVRVLHRKAEVMRDEGGEPLRMVGAVHDVTERKALEEQLQHQALHDPLTSLPNRTLFTDRLRQALARAKRRGSEVAVLFMDLDNFKVINDSLGHKMGDRLLIAVSKRVKAVLRPEDTVARLGGDEFIFLLEDTDMKRAIRVAERVSERLREPFSLGRRRLFISVSIGIASGNVKGKYAADLLRNADLAMYRAKYSGKARYAVFEEAMKTRALERLELEHGLRRALERDEFRLHYQPQMLLDVSLQQYLRSMRSRAIVSSRVPRAPRITAVEALVRWEHPEHGLLPPAEFVSLAEETGLIVPIGELVLEKACRRGNEWQESLPADRSLAVCVNLSAKQFREPKLTETVSRVLRETGLDPTCLHLEITESTAMSDAPATVATLEDLKALGVRMVIDDFGTGYSSLSYLERFPVDYVKIDRSFVGKVEEDPGATDLVFGMVSLAHALGIKVIAEGVETEGQLVRLQRMRCDLAQGIYFSEPLSGEAVGMLLETNVHG
jgi:diguanylate cyclase (GGDEF)-like protein/PAS domain S-box-containing protein